MFVLSIQGTFMSALTISTVIRLLAYMATCIALPVLRRNGVALEARFRVPGGTIVSLVATALSLWLLASSAARDAIAVVAAAVLGLVIYAGMIIVRERASSEVVRSTT